MAIGVTYEVVPMSSGAGEGPFRINEQRKVESWSERSSIFILIVDVVNLIQRGP